MVPTFTLCARSLCSNMEICRAGRKRAIAGSNPLAAYMRTIADFTLSFCFWCFHTFVTPYIVARMSQSFANFDQASTQKKAEGSANFIRVFTFWFQKETLCHKIKRKSSQCFKNSMVYCNICYLIKVLLYAKCLKTECLYFVVRQSTILVILHIHVICIPCVHCTLPYSVLCTM